jgi:hypothetical protein
MVRLPLAAGAARIEAPKRSLQENFELLTLDRQSAGRLVQFSWIHSQMNQSGSQAVVVRRHLAGDGDDGPLWRSCGEAIEAAALPGHLPAKIAPAMIAAAMIAAAMIAAAMIAAANATFRTFEAWLAGAASKGQN